MAHDDGCAEKPKSLVGLGLLLLAVFWWLCGPLSIREASIASVIGG